VLVHEANLRAALSTDKDAETLCKDTKVRDAALKQLNETGKKAGFRTLEMLQDVILTHVEWTPQNGLTTAAQKLNVRSLSFALSVMLIASGSARKLLQDSRIRSTRYTQATNNLAADFHFVNYFRCKSSCSA